MRQSYIQGNSTFSSYSRKPATFEAKKGQPSLWTVRLPDERTRSHKD